MKEDIFEGFIWVVDLQIQVQIQIDEWENNSEEGVSVNYTGLLKGKNKRYLN